MKSLVRLALSVLAGLVAVGAAQAADVSEIRVDWATYNPEASF